MPKYQMDNSTWEHLTEWCQRNTHTEDEAQVLRDDIVQHLEALDVEDAEYSLNHGWTHVRDVMEG